MDEELGQNIATVYSGIGLDRMINGTLSLEGGGFPCGYPCVKLKER